VQPTLFEKEKISAVDKNINKIDLVSNWHQQIKTLYLSHNHLTSLSNIAQFKNLTNLSLAYNKVQNYHISENCFRSVNYMKLIS
jgi:Leucine-rich repeat (LRR) protein